MKRFTVAILMLFSLIVSIHSMQKIEIKGSQLYGYSIKDKGYWEQSSYPVTVINELRKIDDGSIATSLNYFEFFRNGGEIFAMATGIGLGWNALSIFSDDLTGISWSIVGVTGLGLFISAFCADHFLFKSVNEYNQMVTSPNSAVYLRPSVNVGKVGLVVNFDL